MSIAIGRETSHSCAALVTGYCLAHQYMRNKHFLSGMLVLSKNVPSRRDIDFLQLPLGHLHLEILYYYYYYAINAGLLHEYIYCNLNWSVMSPLRCNLMVVEQLGHVFVVASRPNCCIYAIKFSMLPKSLGPSLSKLSAISNSRQNVQNGSS